MFLVIIPTAIIATKETVVGNNDIIGHLAYRGIQVAGHPNSQKPFAATKDREADDQTGERDIL